jgi:anti-sigma regulatory factor (Ser/Thr protein kinase)
MVEIISSEQTQAFTITEASGVGQARRAGADLARRLGLGETQVGKLALIVTEAASNLVKHAGAGTLVVRELANNDQRRNSRVGPGTGHSSAR